MLAKKNKNSFSIKIILPTLITVILFISTIFFVVIPRYKANIMIGKQEMIKELTNSACSILAKYENDERNGLLSKEEAQQTAISRIQYLRYGQNNKDYFWITNMQPVMIMHPYRPDLNGQDLSDFKDEHGKKLFVEFANVVQQKQEGFVEYMWQWKDDTSHIVPKLSFVKGFKPWGWIIGTGVYIEDVRTEIASLTRNLIIISISIAIIMALLLFFITHQSLKIEKEKLLAEQKLKESREKYKTLVKASTEGILLLHDNKIAFANNTIQKMLNYDYKELLNKHIDEIIENINLDMIDDNSPSLFMIKTKENCFIKVKISAQPMTLEGKKGKILTIKEITKEITDNKLANNEEINNKLLEELQANEIIYYQVSKNIMQQLVVCDLNVTIENSIKLMNRHQTDTLVITKEENDFIGFVNRDDITRNLFVENANMNNPIFSIMNAPLKTIYKNQPIYQIIDLIAKTKGQSIAVKDFENKIIGVITANDLNKLHENIYRRVITQIYEATTFAELKELYVKLYAFLRPIIESYADVRIPLNLTSAIADAINKRVIELTIEDMGKPPVAFSFIALGSVGRQEQTFVTDQDNAIIFEDAETNTGNEELKKYFLKMGENICTALDLIGYKFCNGNIIAMNPQWCMPMSTWKEYFHKWIIEPTPDNLLEVSIFFDFRFVYGSQSIEQELKNHLYHLIKDKSLFFYHLAVNASYYKVPLNVLGKIITETTGKQEETFNIKNAITPLVMLARIYALKNNINISNTIERIEALKATKAINAELYSEINYSYNFLMNLRLRNQIENIKNGDSPDNDINYNNLLAVEQVILKKILSQISGYQNILNIEFKGIIGN